MTPIWFRFLPGFVRDRLDGRESLQKALGNTGWMMGDQVVRKSIGLLIARHFGPELYGELSYAIAVYVIFAPLARLSLSAG